MVGFLKRVHLLNSSPKHSHIFLCSQKQVKLLSGKDSLKLLQVSTLAQSQGK